MARIGLNITVSGLTGSLIIRWVRADAPLAEVGRSAAFAFPYDDVYTINNLNRVVYIVQLWRSNDGTALSQLIKDWSIDASMINLVKFTTYQYKVDRGWDNTTPVNTGTQAWHDPSDGDTILEDERLDGIEKADMLVHEAGFGNKLDAEYDLHTGGGIELTGGATFNAGTGWFITVSEVDTTALDPGPGTGTNSRYAGVEILTADQDFDDVTTPLMNKLCIANKAGTVLKIVFPDLTLIADDTHVTFQTHQGSQNYLWLQFNAGDNVKFNNQDVNAIFLAKCEKIELYFKGGVCYITDYDGAAINRGGVVPSFDTLRATNSKAVLLADEATPELLESDYPGLYAAIDAMASGKVAIGTSAGQWSYDSGGGVYPNKRFFGIQTTAPKKIKLPHLTGMVIKYGATPGTYQADGVGPLNIEIRNGAGGSSTNPLNAPMSGFSGMDGQGPWIDNKVAGVETWIRSKAGGPSETTVKSFQQIAYIQL